MTKSNTISPEERESILNNVEKSHAEKTMWQYFLGYTPKEETSLIKNHMESIRTQSKRYCIFHVCETIGTPPTLALAIHACTLPHIKRIYICIRPKFIAMMRTISRHEKIPLITRNIKNMIPYEVLRILGEGRVLFVDYKNREKFELFIEDDLKSHKFCKYFPTTVTGQEKALGTNKTSYKAEWLSDDEVIIR